jgi:hypothetical protein
MKTGLPDELRYGDVPFLALGFVPFACLWPVGQYAVHHPTMLDAPAAVYRGAGVAVSLPAAFSVGAATRILQLIGPEVRVLVDAEPIGDATMKANDVETAAQKLFKQSQFSGTPTKSVAQAQGYRWVVASGPTQKDPSVNEDHVQFLACTAIGNDFVILRVVCLPGGEAAAARLLDAAERTVTLQP